MLVACAQVSLSANEKSSAMHVELAGSKPITGGGVIGSGQVTAGKVGGVARQYS